MRVEELDDLAMKRIASRVRELMVAEYGSAAEDWMRRHTDYVASLAAFTWIAARAELQR